MIISRLFLMGFILFRIVSSVVLAVSASVAPSRTDGARPALKRALIPPAIDFGDPSRLVPSEREFATPAFVPVREGGASPRMHRAVSALTELERMQLRATDSAHILEDAGEELISIAPALVAAVLPYRLVDLGDAVFADWAGMHLAFAAAGADAWDKCCMESDCIEIHRFLSHSHFAKAMFVHLAARPDRVFRYLGESHTGVQPWVSEDQFHAFRSLPLGVIHASLVAAGSGGIAHAILHPASVGTTTYFPSLTVLANAYLDRLLPATDPRWEDLPACRTVVWMISPAKIPELIKNNGIDLMDTATMERGYDIFRSAIRPESIVGPALHEFLHLGFMATAFWIKFTLCTVSPLAAAKLLHTVEPGSNVVTPGELARTCTLAVAQIGNNVRISRMGDEAIRQPILAAIQRAEIIL